MSHFCELTLGAAANLVKGLAPGWNPADNRLDILYAPRQQPMARQAPGPSATLGEWQYPEISLHETPQSLVTALLGYSIDRPAIDPAPPSLPAGALLLASPQGAAARVELSKTLGVSLEDAGLRYALVRLTRSDEVLRHTTKDTGILTTVHALRPDPRIGVNGEFMRAFARMRHFHAAAATDLEGLTPEDANAYLELFAEWGTHFISSISVGDQILQVFAFDAERFARVKTAFNDPHNDFSGAGAVDFRYFTTDANTGVFGFVKQYGRLLCMSNAEVFQQGLAAGDWAETRWAGHNSIFQAFGDNTKVSLDHLNAAFIAKSAIAVTLGPLTTFTEYKRSAIWRGVLKAAMASVFGDSIDPNFIPGESTDFARVIPEDQPGVISAIATPTINIYKARLDLAGMQLVARDAVSSFTTFGYVVSGAASAGQTVIDPPGPRVNLFGDTIDMRTTGRPNVVKLTDAGNNGLTIGCRRFLGAARFESPGVHFLVADGLRYDLDAAGWPVVSDDVRRPPPAESLPLLKDGLEFSLAFAEAVLGLQTGEGPADPTQRLVRDYLAWMTQVIPADTDDVDLLTMRVHALDLGGYAPGAGQGAFVPILPASDYADTVQRILDYLQEIQREISENTIQINQRKQAELTIDVGKTLNQNIIESGQLLTGLIGANAKAAQDLSSQYDAVITSRQAEANAQQAKIGALSKALFEQQADVDEAVQQYKAAVTRWETMELIKFGLDVATQIFSLGTSILIPASAISAVKELGLMAQTIQKLLNVLNNTQKLYTSVTTTVQGLQNAQKTLDGLDGMGFGDTAKVDWDEMSIHLDVVMATGPSGADVTEAKAKLVAAFKILLARGKALVSAQSSLHQIQRDIYSTQRQKQLNDRQAERLKALSEKLHPASIEDLDKDAIDLVGLTGSLEYLRRQMLVTFAKSFLLQDQALQYAWLQEPTPIASYSLLTFMQSRIKQSRATEAAKAMLLQYQASTTKPIVYEVEGVLTADITNGRAYEIVIDPNAPQFRQYVNLRVIGVVAEVAGVRSTDSGKLLVNLTFEGKPFVDRTVERKALCFHTPWRERVYEYDAATGTPDFTDQGDSWSQGISRVTPFGAWLVSLPKTQTNRGLAFDGLTVKVRLTFILEARIVDVPARRAACLRGGAGVAELERLHTNMIALAAAGVSEQPSATALIAHMNAVGTTTNGWDVVFNMGLSQINGALHDQYDALKRDTAYKNVIDVQTRESIVEGVWSIKKFHLEYGYPLLSFMPNNDSTVNLEMPIQKGQLTKCIQTGSDPEKCDPPISMDGKTLTAVVKLDKIAGVVVVDGSNHNVLKVELDMARGAFSVDNIEISDEEKVQLNAAIKAYFAEHPVVYLINALDLTNVPVIDALKPAGFLFKVLRTPGGVDMLQLFIQTGGRQLLNQTLTFLNDVPEPLPLGNDTSLIVRSGLFFDDVLPTAMNRSGWSLAGRASPQPKTASWAEFTNAPVSASNIDLSSLTQTASSGGQGGGSSTVTTYAFPNNTVTWNLSGMTLKPEANGGMTLAGSKPQTMTIKTHTTSSHYPCFWDCVKEWDGSFTNDATSNVLASVPVTVGGTGRNQTIQVAVTSQAVTVTGHLAGGGPSGSDDLQAQVNQKVKEFVPDQIVKQLNVSFTAVSLFAIKNLLFPSNNYITFSQAAVPGDMLVLGGFSVQS